MRLLGGVFNDCKAVRLDSRHHDVNGSAHRHHVEVNVRAHQPVRLDVDHAVVHGAFRPQGIKALQVLVNGPGSQVAASGHGNPGAPHFP